jgi:hypothetical protein
MPPVLLLPAFSSACLSMGSLSLFANEGNCVMHLLGDVLVLELKSFDMFFHPIHIVQSTPSHISYGCHECVAPSMQRPQMPCLHQTLLENRLRALLLEQFLNIFVVK